MSSSQVFQDVGGARPRRSVFDLSYEKKFTCDMGQLIPIMCDEVVPGDIFKIGNELVIRFQPLVAPILHEINAFVHYFFVPYRLLWDSWENFITGGPEGVDTSVLPVWAPAVLPAVNSLWDYLGFPLLTAGQYAVATDWPSAFPQYAYNFIYNEYYRDQSIIGTYGLNYEGIHNRAWEKDYFTSSLLFQQRGIAPGLPISGTGQAIWANDFAEGLVYPTYTTVGGIVPMNADVSINVPGDAKTQAVLDSGAVTIEKTKLNANTVNFGTVTTFNVSDLRLAFQIQKWMERNSRAGARYTEFLKSHYGVSPRDERLQRPEFIGGTRSPVIVSEVLQTSSTDVTTPQANMAGHGITVDRQYAASYRANEFGLIMGLLSVMPRTAYSQGINRQWMRKTRYDFYSPEFAHLSEQAVLQQEIFYDGNSIDDLNIFGYQGRYNEMRYKPNMVVGEMRSTYDYWHLGREFTSAPSLTQTFIDCVPSKRIFAVQNVPGLLVSFANKIKAIRPMPMSAEPGLIDHG